LDDHPVRAVRKELLEQFWRPMDPIGISLGTEITRRRKDQQMIPWLYLSGFGLQIDIEELFFHPLLPVKSEKPHFIPHPQVVLMEFQDGPVELSGIGGIGLAAANGTPIGLLGQLTEDRPAACAAAFGTVYLLPHPRQKLQLFPDCLELWVASSAPRSTSAA
jgi:hypothetical protein